MIRIVHTLWGKPSKNDKPKIKVYPWIYALSASYIKQNEDVQMILYADKSGLDILNDILEIYDEVHEITIPEDISPKFFAAIKAVALEQEPLGSIHIDGDVFIKTKQCFDKMIHELNTCDVVVQGIEPNDNMYNFEVNFFVKYNIKLECTYKHTNPANVGVIGFSNETLRRHYLDNYFKMARYITAEKPVKESGASDLILEQAYLTAYCKQEGYHIGEVISGIDWETCNNNAKKLGFCHLWAGAKVVKLPIIKERLQELNPEIYNKLNNK